MCVVSSTWVPLLFTPHSCVRLDSRTGARLRLLNSRNVSGLVVCSPSRAASLHKLGAQSGVRSSWYWSWCIGTGTGVAGASSPVTSIGGFASRCSPFAGEARVTTAPTVGRQRLPFSKCSSDKQWPGAASDIKAQRSSAATVRSGTSGGHAKIKSG